MTSNDRATDQHPRAGAVRQPDRHHDRVLRLLHLRDRRGAGVSEVCSSRRPIRRRRRWRRWRRSRIAFLARPIGSALFGHFGDRVGRKTTLVAALLTMGLSTVAIGLLPTYAIDRRRRAAVARAVPLRSGPRARRRMGRGGAARHRKRAARQARVVRHVPAARRADRLLLLRRRVSRACRELLSDEQFFAFGWRIPFLASAVLVLVGLYVRLTITETPVFREALQRRERGRRCRWSWCFAITAHADGRHARVARDVRAVLPDDRVHAVVGHDACSATRATVPGHAARRHRLLRADHSDVGDPRRARAARARCSA